MQAKPMVLILCTGNSCRSQMAEGFLKHYQAQSFDVHSAGTAPKDAVHPAAIAVMAEVGIDISQQRPKPLDGFLGHRPVRHLMIVCDHASQTCPRVWPGTFTRTYLPFADPATDERSGEELLEVFRQVRDQIGVAMRDWQPQVER